MSESHVDMTVQATLMKRPGPNYPEKEDIFQYKYVPPIPTDLVKDGQIVIKNMFISIDATNRVWISGVPSYMKPINPGDLMRGMGVAEVLFSKNKKYKPGDKVLGLTYWQKYSVVEGKEFTPLPPSCPNYEEFLGVLGISGLTAYFGLKKIGDLKEGETVVVSTAAGAVGEVVVQLAKHAGCRVVGLTGSDSKCDYVRSIGADEAINYKKGSLKENLKKACPKGVDVYFDNVGGEMLDELLMLIRDNSRIILCGSISSYNDLNSSKPDVYKLKNYSRLVIKRALMKGFLYFDYHKEFPQALAEIAALVKQGKMKYKVDMRVGVEECGRGLADLLQGKNTGKVIIRVDDTAKARL